MLTNHDMDARSPFACLLLGQPTLRRRVKLGTLAALDQRIALRYHFNGMDLGETVSYIKHHLQPSSTTCSSPAAPTPCSSTRP
jgi:type II secretory pathway predicted ATPase ExeA